MTNLGRMTWVAGDDLNALVAREIMGAKKVRGIYTWWSVSPHLEAYRPELHRQYLTCGEENLPMVYEVGEEILDHPPAYSTQAVRALEVVSRMRRDGFSFKLYLFGAPVDQAVVSFICHYGPCEKHGNPHCNHHGAYDVEAETMPLAISKAALIALKKVS